MFDPNHIVTKVAEEYGITEASIFDKRRDDPYPEARFIAYYLCYKRSVADHKTLGYFFRKDRTAIIYGIKQVEQRIEMEVKYRNTVQSIEASLNEQINKKAGRFRIQIEYQITTKDLGHDLRNHEIPENWIVVKRREVSEV